MSKQRNVWGVEKERDVYDMLLEVSALSAVGAAAADEDTNKSPQIEASLSSIFDQIYRITGEAMEAHGRAEKGLHSKKFKLDH